MDALYDETLRRIDKAFRQLERMVPLPRKMPHGDSWVFRYKERTIHQAMIQKLARIVSGLHAARLLCANGLVQEQSAIQRMLDEFHQDISFLALAVINNEITPLHQKYLDAFYREEFDPITAKPLLDRPTVPRKKIRAYLAQFEQLTTIDPSSAVAMYHTVYSANSGFIHGASPHIMDMFGGYPPRFQIHGLAGTPRHEAHRFDLYNYFFRTITSFGLVAKAFGDSDLFQEVRAWLVQFDSVSGRNESYQNAPSRAPQRTPPSEDP